MEGRERDREREREREACIWGWFVIKDVTFMSTVSQMGPLHWRIAGGGGGVPGGSLPKAKFKKNADFVDTMILKALRDFPFSLNPLKSADD
jgi:hypothetical protein